MVKDLGKDFDKPVREWKDSLLPSLTTDVEAVSDIKFRKGGDQYCYHYISNVIITISYQVHS